jgi:hypothetical protein
MAEGPQFNLKEYGESISKSFPRQTLEQLNQMEDFRKAFEINPELEDLFEKAGISGDFGLKGLMPSEWSDFGPVQKTLAEFKNAYDTFREEMLSVLQGLTRKKQRVLDWKKRKKRRAQ